ncbi:MAG: thiamine diphosphokinase [Bacteroidales bacterium]|nr:thiamine diphosphokinase [Bacteroidales bacterium]
MTVTIICNGEFPRSEYPRYLVSSADITVCCDEAVEAFVREIGREPSAVIGDLDSISPEMREKYSSIIIHDSDQETNDLTKAFRYALSKYSPDTIHIVGAGGKREDHTIANLSLLMEYEKLYGLSAKDIAVDMVSDYTTAFAIGDSASFDCGAGRPVSIFSCDPTVNIVAKGLEYPTDKVVFDNWWKASLNRASEDRVSLTLSHPAPVLIILG